MDTPTDCQQSEILVVDDNPANLRLLVNLLSESGYKVRAIPNGRLALAGLQLSLPDLILLDINMPEVDGYQVCVQLKVNERTREIPVIFISALNETLDKVKAFAVGGVDYITKPFQAEEVLARVATHLQLYHFKQNLQATNDSQAQQLTAQNVKLQQMNQTLAEANRELKLQYQQLQQAQLQLVQTEKMATLGQLVAGVGHEINNPLTAVVSNLSYAKEYIQSVLHHLQLYQQHYPHPTGEIEANAADIELEFLIDDLPKLLLSMQTGANRLQHISQSLRSFSRADTTHKVAFDLHEGIDSTLLLLGHRLKDSKIRPAIQVVKHYGDLPLVQCYAGQINQVFMNILANAIDALDEASLKHSFTELTANSNQITICTELLADQNAVVIQIEDNGPGIPEELKAQIFDHLFTTRAVGKGTGLGLSISRQIVMEKHGGTLTCTSKIGEGTEFIITLPIQDY